MVYGHRVTGEVVNMTSLELSVDGSIHQQVDVSQGRGTSVIFSCVQNGNIVAASKIGISQLLGAHEYTRWSTRQRYIRLLSPEQVRARTCEKGRTV
jgi:hypothetical protein